MVRPSHSSSKENKPIAEGNEMTKAINLIKSGIKALILSQEALQISIDSNHNDISPQSQRVLRAKYGINKSYCTDIDSTLEKIDKIGNCVKNFGKLSHDYEKHLHFLKYQESALNGISAKIKSIFKEKIDLLQKIETQNDQLINEEKENEAENENVKKSQASLNEKRKEMIQLIQDFVKKFEKISKENDQLSQELTSKLLEQNKKNRKMSLTKNEINDTKQKLEHCEKKLEKYRQLLADTKSNESEIYKKFEWKWDEFERNWLNWDENDIILWFKYKLKWFDNNVKQYNSNNEIDWPFTIGNEAETKTKIRSPILNGFGFSKYDTDNDNDNNTLYLNEMMNEDARLKDMHVNELDFGDAHDNDNNNDNMDQEFFTSLSGIHKSNVNSNDDDMWDIDDNDNDNENMVQDYVQNPSVIHKSESEIGNSFKEKEKGIIDIDFQVIESNLKSQHIHGKFLIVFQNRRDVRDLGFKLIEHQCIIVEAIQKLVSKYPMPKDNTESWTPLEGQVLHTQSNDSQDMKIDEKYLCPLSKKIMSDPVIASNGTTYQRSAIVQYIEKYEKFPNDSARIIKDVNQEIANWFDDDELKRQIKELGLIDKIID